MDSLLATNANLLASVEKLQIKMSINSHQLESVTRDRNRFQQRAKRLQQCLRSLSWIPPVTREPNHVKMNQISPTSNDEGLGNTTGYEKKSSSVAEVDSILHNLRHELTTLERQLNDHRDAVQKSNCYWKNFNLNDSSDSSLSQL